MMDYKKRLKSTVIVASITSIIIALILLIIGLIDGSIYSATVNVILGPFLTMWFLAAVLIPLGHDSLTFVLNILTFIFIIVVVVLNIKRVNLSIIKKIVIKLAVFYWCATGILTEYFYHSQILYDWGDIPFILYI
ncbi:MAG: hypothetical protein LBH05_05285 [Deferribacteraceae bacterium]|jgi:hypothetical protein|nr:hypothetical protein [Deferribacteraceae bacterium]